MTKVYKSDPNPPSDMFVDSIDFGVGSAEMECGWCGRMHYCPDNDYDYDADEFRKHCEEEYKNDPGGVVLHYDSNSVIGKELNGLVFVVDCPCNGLTRFENFIWNERSTIRNYLTKRVNQEYEWAGQERTRNKLAGFEDVNKERFF